MASRDHDSGISARTPAVEGFPRLEELLSGSAIEEALAAKSSETIALPTPAEHATVVCCAARDLDPLCESLKGRRYNALGSSSRDKLFELLRSTPAAAAILRDGLADGVVAQLVRDVVTHFPDTVVLAIFNKDDANKVVDAFRAGASDVLVPPYDVEALDESLRRALSRRHASVNQRLYQLNLEEVISERTHQVMDYMQAIKLRTHEISQAYRDAVSRLARAAQWRDDETGDHIKRIGLFSAEVARKLGLPDAEVDLIGAASPLHDIGKIGVPDKILLKPGKLTAFEYEYMKKHTLIGAEILSGSDDPLLKSSETIALTHHEWFDGTGYPHKKKRDDIPLFGRIVAVVDVYDAMIHSRPYKQAFPLDETIDTMRQRRGRQFDPAVFDAFLETVEKLVEIDSMLSSKPESGTKYGIKFGLLNMTKHLEETWRK